MVSKLHTMQTAYALSGGAGKFETSAEPGRKRAYSMDIRLRVIYQRIGMGLRFCEIATNLNIAISTAFRIFKQFEISGDIGIPEVRKSRQERRSLDEHSELIVIGLILQTPTLYLHEIAMPIHSRGDIHLSDTGNHLQDPKAVC